MPIQKTVTLQFEASIKAVLRDDVLDVSLSVAAPYGNGRKAAVVVKQFSDKTLAGLKTALHAALAEQLDAALEAAQAKAHEALTVATARGEL